MIIDNFLKEHNRGKKTKQAQSEPRPQKNQTTHQSQKTPKTTQAVKHACPRLHAKNPQKNLTFIMVMAMGHRTDGITGFDFSYLGGRVDWHLESLSCQ